MSKGRRKEGGRGRRNRGFRGEGSSAALAPSPPSPPPCLLACSTFILNRERAVDYLNTLDRLYGACGWGGRVVCRGPVRCPAGWLAPLSCVHAAAGIARWPPPGCARAHPPASPALDARGSVASVQCSTATRAGRPAPASRSAWCAPAPTTPSSCTTCSSGERHGDLVGSAHLTSTPPSRVVPRFVVLRAWRPVVGWQTGRLGRLAQPGGVPGC